MEGITNRNIYRCYDDALRDYLYSYGIKYILTAIDIKTNVQFWAYYRCPKFEQVLEEWIRNNPRIKLWEE